VSLSRWCCVVVNMCIHLCASCECIALCCPVVYDCNYSVYLYVSSCMLFTLMESSMYVYLCMTKYCCELSIVSIVPATEL
jgi:hypothetical protein